MIEQDEKQLWMEIEHIFDSGANELRVFNMVKSFIEKRYQALHIAPVSGLLCGTCTDFKIVGKMFVCKKCGKEQKSISA
jgi:hypothetical protein